LVVIRKLIGVALVLLALALFADPVLTFVQAARMHAAGLGPHALGGVAYLLSAGGFSLIVGLYLLTGGKNRKV
jgi:hypothetical protein